MNGAQAAIRSGYSPRTANRIASENLTKPLIIAALQKAMSERAQRTETQADWVIEQLKENLARAMQTTPVLDSDGAKVGVYNWNGAVANKSIELLGRNIGMRPTNTNLKISGAIDHRQSGQASISTEDGKIRVLDNSIYDRWYFKPLTHDEVFEATANASDQPEPAALPAPSDKVVDGEVRILPDMPEVADDAPESDVVDATPSEVAFDVMAQPSEPPSQF